jgi:hypothetical protein
MGRGDTVMARLSSIPVERHTPAPDQCDIAVLKEERGEVLLVFVTRLCFASSMRPRRASVVTHIGEITAMQNFFELTKPAVGVEP